MDKKRFYFTGNLAAPSGFYNAMIITDIETRVKYLFVQNGPSAGLTLLVDKDGKPLI